MLAKLDSYKRGQNWEQAAETLDEGFQRLIGSGAEAISHLSETEMLAKVIQGEPTQIVHQKTLFLTSFLKEAGDIAAAQDRLEESRRCYLKGLHLLLQTLAQNDESDFPDFVPKVDAFVLALSDSPLPLETNALLMQHYERSGQFDKAEDALFVMAELAPANPAITEFGICFYERLLGQSDAGLANGGLPRPEVEAGLNELRERTKSLTG